MLCGDEMNELSTWNGWTIDLRLRQFRKVLYVDNEPKLDSIGFDTPLGHKIIKEYCQDQYNYHIGEAEAYQRIIFDLEDGSFSNEDAEIIANEMFHGTHGEKG
jgi:hypothetical protein